MLSTTRAAVGAAVRDPRIDVVQIAAIGAIIAIAAMMIVGYSWLPHAEAAVDPGARDRLAELRDRQRDLQDRSDDIRIRLAEISNEINNADRRVDELRDRYRETRAEAGTRWDSLGKVPDAAQAVEDARADLRALYVERSQLLAERARADRALADARNDAYWLAREIKKNTTAVADSQIVSVILGSTCRASLAEVAETGRGSTPCLPYAALADLDQALPGTGELRWDPELYDISRAPSEFKHASVFYKNRTAEPRIILDPPADVRRLSKVIWVEATLPAMTPVPNGRIEFIHNATTPQILFLPWLHTRVASAYCTHVILGAAEAADRYGLKPAILDTAEFLRDGCRSGSGAGKLNMTTTAGAPVWQPPYAHGDSPAWQRHLYWEGRADSCSAHYAQCDGKGAGGPGDRPDHRWPFWARAP